MKFLFLDVDGVLNTVDSLRTHGWKHHPQEKLDLLNEIVAKTGCKIILSSSWRHGLQEYLPFTPHLITPDHYPHGTRADEIRTVLTQNPTTTHWAVIDDDESANLGDGSFFHTNAHTGLTREIASSIITHFDKDASSKVLTLYQAINLLESDVIGELTRNNIKGIKRCGFNCPVAKYIKFKCEIGFISCSRFLIMTDFDAALNEQCITPPNIAKFIMAMDKGEYPQFIG